VVAATVQLAHWLDASSRPPRVCTGQTARNRSRHRYVREEPGIGSQEPEFGSLTIGAVATGLANDGDCALWLGAIGRSERTLWIHPAFRKQNSRRYHSRLLTSSF
jgi:hypothetical protein